MRVSKTEVKWKKREERDSGRAENRRIGDRVRWKVHLHISQLEDFLKKVNNS